MSAPRNVPPAGFSRHRSSPFAEHVGGVFVDTSTAPPTFGMHIADHHANTAGFAHGGVLAMFADLVLGQGIRNTSEGDGGWVTAGLSIDFATAVPVGAWICAQADIQRSSPRATFASCFIMDGDRRVARVSGIYIGRGTA